MNKRTLYSLTFAAIFAFTTLYQGSVIKANAADSQHPLTSPITSPNTGTSGNVTVITNPITPPVINNPTNQPSSNGGSNGGSNSNSNSGSTTCTNESPKNAPYITRALTTGRNQITLFYTAPTQVSGYSVVYGTRSGVYLYGLSGINGAQNSVAINGLTRGVTYFFKVQGVNGCAAGPFSQEIKVKVGSSTIAPVLGAKNTTSKFYPLNTVKTNKATFEKKAPIAAPKSESFLKKLFNLFN